jgi:hypothetical protein
MRWEDALADLVERQERALRDGRWDDVTAVGAEQQALVASLPPLPPSARPVLERALQASLATERALAAGLAETKGALERLRRGRPAIRAYGGPSRTGLDARA